MTEQYPLIMTEEYWANSQLSVARYYGHVRFMGHELTKEEIAELANCNGQAVEIGIKEE